MFWLFIRVSFEDGTELRLEEKDSVYHKDFTQMIKDHGKITDMTVAMAGEEE